MILNNVYYIYIYTPWKSKTKQRMVFRMIHVKDYIPTKGQAVWSTWTSWVHEKTCTFTFGHLDVFGWDALKVTSFAWFSRPFFTSHSFKSQMQVLNGFHISKVIPWIRHGHEVIKTATFLK